MEALKILKEQKEIVEISKENYNYQAKVKFNQAFLDRLNKSIQELENIQSISCENCIYWVSNEDRMSFCSELGVSDIGGCGHYWIKK